MVKYDIDALAAKVGGRFHLTALFQKRVRELMQGAPPLIEPKEGMTYEDIAAEETLQGKLALAVGEEAETLRKKREKELLASSESVKELPWKSLGDSRNAP